MDFSSSPTTLESYKIGDIASDFAYDPIHFHELFIFSDRNNQKMTRSYMRFQDLVSSLGGFSSSYLMITGILISNYKSFLLIFDVFGHLFVLPGVITKNKKEKTLNTKKPKKKTKKGKIEKKETGEKNEKSPLEIETKAKETIKSPINIPNSHMFTAPSERSLPPNTEEGKIEIGDIRQLEIGIHFPDNTEKNISPKISLSPINTKNSSFTIPVKRSTNKINESPKLKKNSFMLTEVHEPKKSDCVRYWEYIKFQLKNLFRIQLSLKESYMLEAKKKFKQEMDVLKILEKLKEVEKLKTIIFNPLQGSAFDIYARQKINLKLRREHKDDDAKSVLIQFSKEQARTPTELDQRLLKSLGIRPKTNFQNVLKSK